MKHTKALIQGKYADYIRGYINRVLLQLRGYSPIHNSIQVYNKEIFLTSFEALKMTNLWQNAPDQVKLTLVQMVNKVQE